MVLEETTRRNTLRQRRIRARFEQCQGGRSPWIRVAVLHRMTRMTCNQKVLPQSRFGDGLSDRSQARTWIISTSQATPRRLRWYQPPLTDERTIKKVWRNSIHLLYKAPVAKRSCIPLYHSNATIEFSLRGWGRGCSKRREDPPSRISLGARLVI